MCFYDHYDLGDTGLNPEAIYSSSTLQTSWNELGLWLLKQVEVEL